MKFVKLLSTAYVNGVMRHPHEGILHVEDDEAQRLFDNEAAEDVTSDFSPADNADVATETISATPEEIPDEPLENPPLSEVMEDKAAAKAGKQKDTSK